MRTIVDTTIAVRIGRTGAKSHKLVLSVQQGRDGRAAVYSGQTYCGSQRFTSGWSVIGLNEPITCTKCGPRETEDRISEYSTMRVYRIADPLRVIQELPRNSYARLTPTTWAASLVTESEA